MKSRDRKRSMLDHMHDVFEQLILHYPQNSIDKLEEVSYLLKRREDLSKYLRVADNRNYMANANCSKDYIAKGMG